MANLLAPCRPMLQILVVILSLGCALPALAVPPPLPTALTTPSVPFLPYTQYLLDPSGSMDISEVAAARNSLTWRSPDLRELPRGNGALWLRFRLAPVPSGQRPGIFMLDMGQSLPGVPVLFEPVYNALSASTEWRDSVPAGRNTLLLPEPGAESMTCYIRLDGLPGLWFAPMLRTPHDAATDLYSLCHWAALLALGVVMLLCIIRGLSEHGQWRIWTACFVAAALGQGLSGMPAVGSGQIGMAELPEILLPGMALMLLPHVGRHLMQTPFRSRALDVQLVLLSLPGAVLALLPLIPGYGWLCRYLDLWPALTLLFVPTALGAWMMGLAGSKRFLLGCLLPPLFVAGGIVGLESDIPSSVLASLPLWGVALSALLVAATRAPSVRDSEESSRNAAAEPAPTANDACNTHGDDVIALEQPLEEAGAHPMNDPALRLIPAATVTPAAATGHTMGQGELSPAFWEAVLQEPLDSILHNGAALEGCSLPPAVRSHAAAMVSAARQLAQIIAAPDKGREVGSGGEPSGAFNLQYLMRDVHDAVAPAAESAGIGLAWYMPPQLTHMYEGAAASLGATLRLLLESAIQATSQGAVHFSVRPRPEGDTPGDLLFTITDSGTGLPPQDRSMLGLSRAWEMAGRHGGSLGVECGPKGATIAFTVRLRSLEQTDAEQCEPHADRKQKAAEAALPPVVVVAPEAAQRQEVAAMLTDLPCRCVEAASLADAVPGQEGFVPLLIVRGPEASPSAAVWIRRLENGNAACAPIPGKVLAITPDDSQWGDLADAGFTHALVEPVDAADLRQTVREVLAALTEVGQAPAGSRPAGRPPLPDLFGPTEDAPSPLQMPDLTALPDLMRFAEELHASGSSKAAADDPLALSLKAAPEAVASQSPASRLSEQEEAAFMASAGLEGPLWLGEADPVQDAAPQVQATPELTSAVAAAQDARLETTVEGAQAGVLEANEAAAALEGVSVADVPASEEAALAVSTPPAVMAADTVGMPEPQPEAPPVPLADPAETLEMPLAMADSQSGQKQAAPPLAERLGATIVPVRAPADTAHPAEGLLEWVGEPMPIAAGQPREEAVAMPRAVPQAMRSGSPDRAATAQDSAPRSSGSGYTSPSLRLPGEWVGEPMPIVQPQPAARPGSQAGTQQTPTSVVGATPASCPETATGPAFGVAADPAAGGSSLMDFIVGATPVKKEQPPLPSLIGEVPQSSPESAGDAGEEADARTAAGTAPAMPETAPSDTASPTAGQPRPAPVTSPASPPPDTAIVELVGRLDAAMDEAKFAFKARRAYLVGTAAGRIAADADAFGFRVLARMARCVESAAKANDMMALEDLLPELAVAVERNRIALSPRK